MSYKILIGWKICMRPKEFFDFLLRTRLTVDNNMFTRNIDKIRLSISALSLLGVSEFLYSFPSAQNRKS